MKIAIISLVIGSIGVAIVNAVRPIQDTISLIALILVMSFFSFVYINLWKNKIKNK